MIQTVTLKSETKYGERIPPEPVGHLISQVPAVVRQAVRMAFQGRSTASGRRAPWLSAMADVRVIDLSGGEDTVIRFDTPQFGEVASELYEQRELWPSRPDPEDTGFDVLGDIFEDLAGENSDSDRFDHQLLKGVARFRNVINGYFQEMVVTGRRYPQERPAALDEKTIATAEQFYNITPAPTRARVVGTLDMIRASTQSFALRLDDGKEVQAVLVTGKIGDLAQLWRQRVVALGEAVFRVSGRLLRIDAENLVPAVDESPIWSQVPRAANETLNLRKLRQPQGPRSGLAAILGRWPGDETDEEIAEALRQLS